MGAVHRFLVSTSPADSPLDTSRVHPTLRAAAERRYGVFTTAEALAVGYGVAEIRNLTASGRWVRLRRGILIDAVDLERAQHDGHRLRVDCLAVLLRLDRPAAAVSHGTAARLWGLPRPRSTDDVLRLTDPSRWRRGEGNLMSRAPLAPGDVWRAGPVGLTSAPRTLVDCAREWPLEDGVVAMDAALPAGRTTADELRLAAAAASRWPGASRAVRAAALADPRAASPLETRGRLRLIRSGLPPTALQVEIRAGARLVGIVDAWFEEAAVAVEFDGRVEYADPWRNRSPERVLWEEKRREDGLRSLDIRVVRIVDEDLGVGWRDIERRLGGLLGLPRPADRRFTRTARTAALRRTG